MGHLTMAAGAACVALMISSSAFAQVQPTPNPNNPNDAIPEASNLPPYGDPINIETAKKVAAAAVAESKKRNWNTMCVAVVDPHGELVYFERLDNCQYGRSRSRSTKRAPRHATAVRRWYLKTCSAKATTSNT